MQRIIPDIFITHYKAQGILGGAGRRKYNPGDREKGYKTPSS